MWGVAELRKKNPPESIFDFVSRNCACTVGYRFTLDGSRGKKNKRKNENGNDKNLKQFFGRIFSAIGWRLGLQLVTATVFTTFLLGTCYRSASLYHPQRRAILHLKNQKRKIKDKNRHDDRPPFLDFTTLRSKTVRILLVSTGISAFGINTPIFYLVSGNVPRSRTAVLGSRPKVVVSRNIVLAVHPPNVRFQAYTWRALNFLRSIRCYLHLIFHETY